MIFGMVFIHIFAASNQVISDCLLCLMIYRTLTQPSVFPLYMCKPSRLILFTTVVPFSIPNHFPRSQLDIFSSISPHKWILQFSFLLDTSFSLCNKSSWFIISDHTVSHTSLLNLMTTLMLMSLLVQFFLNFNHAVWSTPCIS